MEDGSGGTGRGGASGEPEAFEGEHAEMIFDERDGVVGGEGPVVERGLGPAEAGVDGGQAGGGSGCAVGGNTSHPSQLRA